MKFIDEIKARAKQDVKTIVLPETRDKRTLIAAAQVLKEGYRTVDIMSDGMTQCSTTQMGDLIAEII